LDFRSRGTWYEAHIVTPEFELYVIGRNTISFVGT
jgi:hypothetical protein